VGRLLEEQDSQISSLVKSRSLQEGKVFTPDGIANEGSGRLLAQNASCWIVDPDNHDELQPVGSIGELLIGGPIVGLQSCKVALLARRESFHSRRDRK
jgi:acyl-CoA synthetase (AMP-forming)/AMP-acid ligase II